MRVDTDTRGHAHCRRSAPSFAAVSLNVARYSGGDAELILANGDLCPSTGWQYESRRIIAVGYSGCGKTVFSDQVLRTIGLAGRMLVDELFAVAKIAENGIDKPADRLLPGNAPYYGESESGEYWKDKHNWRIRETLVGRTRRRARRIR